MNILFIGDIVGRTGRKAVKVLLPQLKEKYKLDLIIANGENAAGGFGITKKVADELNSYGVNCITMGNHTWDNKDIFNIIEEYNIVRPLNYNKETPGKGWKIINFKNYRVAVINLIGQVFMGCYNSPFCVYKEYISLIKEKADIIVVDLHAEATAEKLVFANYVDGEVACVVGTHTHIQTADERILPKGTGYITDLGLTGAQDSILGMAKEEALKRFTTQIPTRLKVKKGNFQLEGVIIKINENTGLSQKIIRIQEVIKKNI